jgi:hypothetical protein
MTAGTELSAAQTPSAERRLEKPVIVIGCNRSGTTLLFNNLSWHPDTWSLYVESQAEFYRYYPIHPELGDRIDPPFDPAILENLRHDFYQASHNKEFFKDRPVLRHIHRKILQRPLGRMYRPKSIRLVEKTPANCFRIPLLRALFPGARFLFLVRRGEDVVSSLMEGWKNWSGTGTGEWRFTRWHYLVPPGWQSMKGARLEEICAFQWAQALSVAWKDLNAGGHKDFLLLRHEEVMANPQQQYRDILRFCELRESDFFAELLRRIETRVYTTGGSKPRREKWRELHGSEITSVLPQIESVNRLFYPAPA